jgi:hypothetical protein
MSAEDRWRTSSFSGLETNCVAVAHGAEEVRVRDSKQPSGPVLAFSRGPWGSLLERLAD